MGPEVTDRDALRETVEWWDEHKGFLWQRLHDDDWARVDRSFTTARAVLDHRVFDPSTTQVMTYCTLHDAYISDFVWNRDARYCAEYDPEGPECEAADFYMVPAVEDR